MSLTAMLRYDAYSKCNYMDVHVGIPKELNLLHCSSQQNPIWTPLLPMYATCPAHLPSSSAPCSQVPLVYVPPFMSETKGHTRTKLQAKIVVL